MKVAILDDDDTVRHSITKLLKVLGHESIDFGSEDIFLSSIEQFQPDVILIDQMLGAERNGIQLVEEVHHLLANVPIIIISGFPAPSLREAVALKENVSFLAKPFRVAQIVEKLDEVLSA